jgi:hypothetical protein
MKVYSVKPSSTTIRVSDGRELHGDGEISWGDSGAGSTYLCRAILTDIYGDKNFGEQFATRLKYRTVINWSKDEPHAITEEEVRKHVDDMQRIAAELAPMIERIKREKPQFVSDQAGPGQKYDSNPILKPNLSKEQK